MPGRTLGSIVKGYDMEGLSKTLVMTAWLAGRAFGFDKLETAADLKNLLTTEGLWGIEPTDGRAAELLRRFDFELGQLVDAFNDREAGGEHDDS